MGGGGHEKAAVLVCFGARQAAPHLRCLLELAEISFVYRICKHYICKLYPDSGISCQSLHYCLIKKIVIHYSVS